MKDFVRVVKEYCDAKTYAFVTGTKSVQNLFDEAYNVEGNKVHLFLDPVNRVSERTNTTGVVISKLNIGTFGLLVRSDLDHPYFEEMNNDGADSKYTMNIEPLFDICKQIQHDFACDGLDVVEWSEIDASNLFDENFDGVIVSYKIRTYV